MAKKVYVTYCSAEKSKETKDLPAIDRYESDRIDYVHALAKQDKARFMILSGKFGLLEPSTKIPYYDHLLKAFETNRLGKTVAKQLKQHKGISIVFHSHWIDKDMQVAPYIEVMTDACELAKIPFELMILDEEVSL
ncbi:MAG: hypothetical protein HWE22_14125 [Flavobacteriales bacterium]|nr:hypothetical protein [Flavobacteriales bacterium]